MKEYKDQMLSLYKSGLPIADIAKKICKENNIEFTDSKRRRISAIINKEKNKGVFDECEAVGIDPEKIKNYWYKGKHYSINVKGETDTFKYEDFKEDFIASVKDIKPNYIQIIRTESEEESYCLLIDPADIHVNKLCSAFETGEEYNSQIAVQRVRDGVSSILSKSKGFNIDKIILIVGNDVLNTDNT